MQPIQLGNYTFGDKTWALGATALTLVAGYSIKFFKQKGLRAALGVTTLASGATAAFFGQRVTRPWRTPQTAQFTPPTLDDIRQHATSLGLAWSPQDYPTRRVIRDVMNSLFSFYVTTNLPSIDNTAAYKDNQVRDKINTAMQYASVCQDLLLLEFSMSGHATPQEIASHLTEDDRMWLGRLAVCYHSCRYQHLKEAGGHLPAQSPDQEIIARYYQEGTLEAGWRQLFNRGCAQLAPLAPYFERSPGVPDEHLQQKLVPDHAPAV